MGKDRKEMCGVTRRQAWQFVVAPIELKDGELHVLSTAQFAPRALRFVHRVLRMRACVRLVSDRTLRERLERDFGGDAAMPLGKVSGEGFGL